VSQGETKARATGLLVVTPDVLLYGAVRGQGAAARWVGGSVRALPIPPADTPGMALQALAAELAGGTAPAALHVLVADNLLAIGAVASLGQARQGPAAEAQAREQLRAAGFDIDPSALVRLDDVAPGLPCLAVAYPPELMRGLADCAARAGCGLVSVLPLSVAAWAAARADAGTRLQALTVAAPGLALVLHNGGGTGAACGDVVVRTDDPSGAAGARRVADLWRRLGLRNPVLGNVEHVALLHLLDGTPDPAWRGAGFTMLDPLAGDGDVPPLLRLAAGQPRSRHPLDACTAPPSWTATRVACLAGAAVLAVFLAWQAGQQTLWVARLRAQLAGLRAPAPAVESAPAWTREEIARIKVVNGAVRQLNLPIADILRALKPPPDLRVTVLGVDASSATAGAAPGVASSVKIVAQAQSGAEMARYAAYVGSRAPFTSAYLVGHDVDGTGAAQTYRFTLEALWTD
jgi:hypothetical protein